MRLATFLHISDLHFGKIDPDTYDAITPNILAKLPPKVIEGLLGHSYNSLTKLKKFFSNLKNRENAELIVTGDLTSFGHHVQFRSASTFLGSILKPPAGNYLGLEEHDWKDRAIPGNHDHWPGSPLIFGGPTKAFESTFPNLPYAGRARKLSDQHRLRILGIDTDADVSPTGMNRFLGRGSFCGQLKKLQAELAELDPNEIRVLLLHHSRSHHDYELGIDENSRRALDEFLVDYDIPVVLSGHLHRPLVVPSDVTHLGRQIEVLEARCGSTTRLTTVPYDWRNLLGRRPQLKVFPNSLLVHRLQMEDFEICWETDVYWEGPFGFVRRQREQAVFPRSKAVDVGGEGPDFRMRIWPRPDSP